ncbi:cAMP-binding protein [Minicystis rosea]|nr:cAMP-binding protein [Minicystis rosea]
MSSEPDSQDGVPSSESGALRAFQPGEVIFRQGDPSAEAYLLEEGSVRLIKKVRGADRSLSIVKPGDLFGESALVAGAPRSSTAVAITAGLARAVAPTTLAALITRHPSAGVRMVEQLAARLYEAEDQIEIMMLSDTQSKVVSALVKLAEKARAEGPGAAFAISPMELSARVGLDVDAVKRTVQQLREGQYIKVSEARLEIPDIDALRRLYALLGVKEDLRGEAG